MFVRTLMFSTVYYKRNQGHELSEPWKAASPGDMTLSGFCVFVLFS